MAPLSHLTPALYRCCVTIHTEVMKNSLIAHSTDLFRIRLGYLSPRAPTTATAQAPSIIYARDLLMSLPQLATAMLLPSLNLTRPVGSNELKSLHAEIHGSILRFQKRLSQTVPSRFPVGSPALWSGFCHIISVGSHPVHHRDHGPKIITNPLISGAWRHPSGNNKHALDVQVSIYCSAKYA